ncbi:MAG: hypothetical protein IH963_03750 [Chloroflexi bacterium]|nr:hypothetical protein [Chloroflexota bacterium]
MLLLDAGKERGALGGCGTRLEDSPARGIVGQPRLFERAGNPQPLENFRRRAGKEREELLRELWIEKEKARARVEPLRMDEGLLNDLVRSGFGRLEGKTFLFEEVGELKGRELTRRHRIAERFFSDVFRIDNNRVDDLAHRFDPLLNPEMTENLCIFMNHPRTCPHGDPIPPGKCCAVPSP